MAKRYTVFSTILWGKCLLKRLKPPPEEVAWYKRFMRKVKDG